LPQYAPEFGYGNTSPNNPATISEPNKEDYSAANANTPVGPPPGLISCPQLPGYGYHIVQPKETLAAIARTYNVDIKKIQKWNGIENANHIEICQKVWVTQPPANTVVSKGVDKVAKPKAPAGATVNSQKIYWNQAGTPAAYSTPTTGNNVTYLPTQYSTTGNPYYFTQQPQAAAPTNTAARPTVHIVQKGESVYSISKRYTCAEECVRRANGMPLEGNVALQINQQIIIPECSCQTTTPAPAATGYQPNQTILTNPGTGNVLNPAGTTNTPTPITYSTPTYTNPDPTYLTNPTEPYSETSVFSNNNQQLSKGVPNTNQAQTAAAAYFQEYVVKQGDTLGSVAAKFKVSSAELVQVNSLEANETLMPGKRLLIPRTN
jgi:LysM repeat protein